MARFDKKLVLSRWMLAQFGVDEFSHFQNMLSGAKLIGFDEENISHFHHELVTQPFPARKISNDTLLAYDENIVRFWRRITEKRNHGGSTIYPLYFQYLALLFTEHYLNRYFKKRAALCDDLNNYLEDFNETLPEREHILPFVEKDLNKLAIWIATGGGKTLIMHVNVLQFFHYRKKAGNNNAQKINRTILLTPNEGLSRQHLTELEQSGITASLFDADKPAGLWKSDIDIIDIHKLKDTKGDKTVAVDSFESNNLVLVDEGHRGAGGKEWMAKRNQLCIDGFSFEYSATFGQAIKATAGSEKPTEKGREKSKKYQLIQQYGKCILFDYSYKFFHDDGYGKDHLILNLDQAKLGAQRQLYLTACLLAFYQQKKFYTENKASIAEYLLADPLWIFVGGKVTAQNRVNEKTASDIQRILDFLSRFLHNKGNESKNLLELLLSKEDDLRDSQGERVFSSTFPIIHKLWKSDQAAELFQDIVKVVFHAGSAGNLHVVHLKGSGGEIGLRVGAGEFFGLINVGDDTALIKLCRNSRMENMIVTDQTFSSSYFQTINKKESPINLLIGAKKFTEGWSSWRVSTMGLMNVGRAEGSEIIQLFGRGVRLKGYGFSLKRSSAISNTTHPQHLPLLETLNVFGIRSNYMKEFKAYLDEEGVSKDNIKEIILPVIKRDFSDKLKLIRLKQDIAPFVEEKKPWLARPPKQLTGKITLDCYPKIQAQKSLGNFVDGTNSSLNEGVLSSKHLAFLDFDKIYLELVQYKSEKKWFNMQLSRGIIEELLTDTSWYRLLIPAADLEIKDFSRIQSWHELSVALLKKYCKRYYSYKKNEYEAPHLEYCDLNQNDDNFIEEYTAMVDKSQEEWIDFLEELAEKLTIEKEGGTEYKFSGQRGLPFGGVLKIFDFSGHLYKPLIYMKNNEVLKISPVSLNDGERDFVEDLRDYYLENREQFKNKQLYLLRNQSKKGVAFFLAGNFYPDFILWIVDGSKQYVSFIDPKGLRHVHGLDDPKISFHKKIKEIESSLNDPDITLNSFIVSNTYFNEIKWWSNDEPEQTFADHHVLFQKDNRDGYIGEILKVIGA